MSPKPDIVDCYHGTDLTDAFVHGLAAAGVKMFIHKATQGVTMKDPMFTARMARVDDFNATDSRQILRGAYHGLNGSDPVEQVSNFLSSLSGVGRVVPVLDVERLGSDTVPTAEVLKVAIATMVEKTGHHPVLYGSDVLGSICQALDSLIWRPCPFWIAKYSEVAPTWHAWQMWQYDEFGTVAGVGSTSGELDLSTFANQGSLGMLSAYAVTVG